MERDRRISDEDMAVVSDSPEWTEDEFARSKSFAEAFPDLAASLKDGVSVVVAGTTPVSIRLADDVLAHYRNGGGDWEARINADLRKAAGIEGLGRAILQLRAGKGGLAQRGRMRASQDEAPTVPPLPVQCAANTAKTVSWTRALY